MTLGFMQRFPWDTKKNPAPTNFREKILACAGIRQPLKEVLPLQPTPPPFEGGYIGMSSRQIFTPKIHTMRTDPHNRWKPGMSIQMVYRGPKYSILDHFNKGIPELEKCISTQKIEIKWRTNKELFNRRDVEIFVDDHSILEACVVDNIIGMTSHYRHLKGIVQISTTPSDLICLNDGFDSIHDFLLWFNKDWEGKIIHWTDFKY